MLRVQFNDGSEAVYGETDLLQLELALAMTTHKAQGSEFAYVIGTFAMDQFTMLSCAIAYTFVTRDKKRYYAICQKKGDLHGDTQCRIVQEGHVSARNVGKGRKHSGGKKVADSIAFRLPNR